MFFRYKQNASFGVYGAPAVNVWIEAENCEEANKTALKEELYFDGVEKGIDCPCCGDRWYELYNEEGYIEPEIKELRRVLKTISEGVTDHAVIYKDGRKEYFHE